MIWDYLHIMLQDIICHSAPLVALFRIGGLAGQVMRMVEALVKKSDSQITDSASVLQKIIAAAADEKGEWHLPLSDDNVASMKQVGSNSSLRESP